MLVHRKPELAGAICRPYPGALHPDSAPAEGDLTGLVAVTNCAAIRVVAALWPDDLGDLFFHELSQDAKPHAHRERQQTLLGDSDKLPERLLDAWGQRAFGVRVGLCGRYGF